MAFIDIPTILANKNLRLALIYLPNFAWFFAGFVQFSLRSHRFRGALAPAFRSPKTATTTTPRIGDLWHQDLLIYLGAFGAALAASVLDAAYADLASSSGGGGKARSLLLPIYLRLWGAAHASQGITGWARIRPSGRWDWERWLGPITYTDTVLCLWDFTLAFWCRS